MLIYQVTAVSLEMRTNDKVDEYNEPSPRLAYASLDLAKANVLAEKEGMDEILEEFEEPIDLVWAVRPVEKEREGYTGRSWTAEAEHHGLTYFIHELVLIGAQA